MTTSYIVDGMTCGHCAQAVTNAIQELSAGTEVSVDLEKKTVTVNGFEDDKAIADAVEDAGFDFISKA